MVWLDIFGYMLLIKDQKNFFLTVKFFPSGLALNHPWLNKTITEEEKKEEGMVYAALRIVLDSG